MKKGFLWMGLYLTSTLMSFAQENSIPLVRFGDTALSHADLHGFPGGGILQKQWPLPGIFIPAIGIGYGLSALSKGPFKTLDRSTRNEIREDHPLFHTSLDNYLQYGPAATLLVLHAAGVPGQQALVDEICLYGFSSLVLFGTVQGLKRITREQRPDGSTRNSFPSGHTATAFSAAEWLRMEYRDRPWIGVTGYAAATVTGVLRVYNNRHWVSDVIAGAALGFLSTRLAYVLQPRILHLIHRRGQRRGKTPAIP